MKGLILPELLGVGDKSFSVISFTGGNLISSSINPKPVLDVNLK